MQKTTNYSSPLYVDLDGTFIKSDILHESFLVALKLNPLVIFSCFLWLLKGKSYLKYRLSLIAEISSELLPLNGEFYEFLLSEKLKKRSLILATASNESYARKICQQYPMFDSYLASDQTVNLSGQRKLDKIKTQTETFSYAGNSHEDFILFEKAEESILVNPTKRAKRMSYRLKPSKIFDDTRKGFGVWLKQIRIHQWLKNTLVFVPLLVTKGFTNIDLIILSVAAFFSFSLLASATYIVNDLIDLQSDRSHPRKKNRPLAAGTIGILQAKLVAFVFLVSAFLIATSIVGNFVWVLSAYLLISLSYSFKIKTINAMDVIVLACLYTIRIIAGAAVLDVPVSFWLLSFSLFIFLSLALVKRCSELKSLEKQGKSEINGREYILCDYVVSLSFGVSSAMIAVLMFSFYINNNILTNQFQTPTILWLIVPALSYWLMRMWSKTNRSEMHDDPIIFSLTDKGSLLTVSFIVGIAVIAQIL